MTQIKLDDDKNYRLTKVHPDGRYEVKITGQLQNPDGIVEIDKGVVVGRGISSYWATSMLTEIIPIHNGIKFETLNSTYILEVYEPSSNR